MTSILVAAKQPGKATRHGGEIKQEAALDRAGTRQTPDDINHIERVRAVRRTGRVLAPGLTAHEGLSPATWPSPMVSETKQHRELLELHGIAPKIEFRRPTHAQHDPQGLGLSDLRILLGSAFGDFPASLVVHKEGGVGIACRRGLL